MHLRQQAFRVIPAGAKQRSAGMTAMSIKPIRRQEERRLGAP